MSGVSSNPLRVGETKDGVNSSDKRVILWTAPRCISTAFERCIINLKNSKVLHEPFSAPFYFGPERQHNRYSDQPADPQKTYDATCKLLQKEYDGKELVFSKDMPCFINSKFEMFLREGFRNFKHSFLVRDPRKAIVSFYKASTTPSLTGWSYFDPTEAGFVQMYEFYRFVRQHLDPSPVVVDADDLLDDPEGIMKSYCESVGIDYQRGMTRWDPGPVDAGWETWAGWHEDVLKSSGITPRNHRQPKSDEEPQAKMPSEVMAAVEKAIPCYNAMHSARIHAKKPRI